MTETQSDPRRETPRVVRDFALFAGITILVMGAILTAFGAFVDLETVPALLLGTGVLFVVSLLVGSFGGLVLGVARDTWPESPLLWPLGFLLGVGLGIPPSLLVIDEPAAMLTVFGVCSALLGPPLGMAWAAWLLVDGRGRDPRPILGVLAVGTSVVYLLVLGVALVGTRFVSSGPGGVRPPPAPVAPAVPVPPGGL